MESFLKVNAACHAGQAPTAHQIKAATAIQALVRGGQVRQHVYVASVAPGMVHGALKGDSQFFDRVGMSGINTGSGASAHEKELHWISVSPKYLPHLAGGKKVYRPVGMLGEELKNTLSWKQSPFQKPFSKSPKGPTAYINASFYNAGRAATPFPPNASHKQVRSAGKKYPEHATIGKSEIPGVRLPHDIAPPEDYAAEYHKTQLPNGSYFHSGPLLAQVAEGSYEKSFTQEKIDRETDGKWKFQKNAFVPGKLSHAEHPNPRSALSLPANFNVEVPRDTAKTNNTRLIVGKDGGKVRGAEGEGFTMLEWSTVAHRLGSFNLQPGTAVNLDGGASSVIGVLDESGSKLLEVGGTANPPTASTFVAMQEAPGSVLPGRISKWFKR